MAKTDLTNLHINSVNTWKNGTQQSYRAALCWENDNKRYHIWFGLVEGHKPELEDSVFVNPPSGTKPTGPGYFATRKIDPNGPTARWMLSAVMEHFEQLWAIAKTEHAAAELKREAERREQARLNRMEEAAPQMYDLLKERFDHLTGAKAQTPADVQQWVTTTMYLLRGIDRP